MPLLACMAIRAVVFDLDGTLVDTLADIAWAINAALRATGLPTHPLCALRRFVGRGAAHLAACVTPAHEQHRSAEVFARFQQFYAARLVVESRPYDGVEPMLASLSARGVSLAVLSNKPDALTKQIVLELFPERFAAVYGQRDDVPMKPDPAALHAIAAQLGVRTDELTMVGDSGVDVTTAKNAGALAVGVTWGYRPETELVHAGAHHVIAHPSALRMLLG